MSNIIHRRLASSQGRLPIWDFAFWIFVTENEETTLVEDYSPIEETYSPTEAYSPTEEIYSPPQDIQQDAFIAGVRQDNIHQHQNHEGLREHEQNSNNNIDIHLGMRQVQYILRQFPFVQFKLSVAEKWNHPACEICEFAKACHHPKQCYSWCQSQDQWSLPGSTISVDHFE